MGAEFERRPLFVFGIRRCLQLDDQRLELGQLLLKRRDLNEESGLDTLALGNRCEPGVQVDECKIAIGQYRLHREIDERARFEYLRADLWIGLYKLLGPIQFQIIHVLLPLEIRENGLGEP